MKIKVIPILLLLPFFAFSQTAEEKRKLASFSNKEANAVLAKELKKEEQQRKLRLDAYLKSNPQVSKEEINDDGFGKKELMDVLPNGEKIYAQTHNAVEATFAKATSLYSGGSLGTNIQGQNMIVGVWDGGNVRTTHQEFMVGGISKVSNWNNSSLSDHATHVAGTIAAQGIVANLRGLAFNSSIIAFDWTNDISEMLVEAANGLLVSNHSYSIGPLSSRWYYGAYDTRARQFDQIVYNNPYYLPVIAAGNDRNNTLPPASTQISQKGGYDLIFGHGNAKNVVTVAAVGGNNTNVTMSPFSSYGPSDDGRIKPDIAMKGVSVTSLTAASDTASGTESGTSMAAPGVSGVIILLQQYYNQLYDNYMKAATVKGLILHTATESGWELGPDYQFGWGILDAERAAKVIRDKNLTVNRSIIEENSLISGGSYSKMISASGTSPLQVSISWTDPAADSNIVNNGNIDPSTVYLVNDLDVKVVSSTGIEYFPWRGPGMNSPSSLSTNNSSNNVDNFERVDIENPNGTYTILVAHKGNLLNNLPQDYTLTVTGDNLSAVLETNEVVSSKVNIYPNPASDFIYITNLGGKKYKFSIIDNSGRIIIQKEMTSPELDISALTPGNYILVLKNDQIEISHKFIKK